jgi:acylphosphatase
MIAARKRIRAVASGLVQGVNFRSHAARAARELGLTGWVRNRDDGTVELEAQGSSRAVDELLGRIRTGPPWARVDGVDVEPLEPIVGESGFEIRR